MKAISLHQPWASLIASGKKTIETRRWATSYRGDLLIVSTRKPEYDDLPLGKALCIVEVYFCRPMVPVDEADACCQWYAGAWSWLLRNIRPIEPFAVRGLQGFYEIALPAPAHQGPTDEVIYSSRERKFVNRQSASGG